MAQLDSNPKSIQSLYGWYAEGQLWVNRRYQRKLVWTLEEKQKLVESVLNKYPIPAILMAEREGGGFEVIDGLQRLHTLTSFIEMRFPTSDGRYFAVAEFPTANTRSGEGVFAVPGGVEVLNAREVGTFLDYTLATTVMRGAVTDEIDDVFGRINTYGHRLSDQERRQAGVRNTFSSLVRTLACDLRGDVSSEELGLAAMPTISIDLPKSKHGYEVSAQDVFWVEQGILRATDLRDSVDEQCIADIAACLVIGELLERSKDALDDIYKEGTPISARVDASLTTYGSEKLVAEFKFVVDEVTKIVGAGDGKLRDLLFKNRTTNPFPALFAVLFIAVHESLLIDGKTIANYASARQALVDLSGTVETSRAATGPLVRRRNVDVIKGLLAPSLIPAAHRDVYGEQSTFDIDEAIRRSEVELPHYELKQGLLKLDGSNQIDPGVLPKIVQTICAIANNGPGRGGVLIVGVADSHEDAKRVKDLYGTPARQVGRREVVGVLREARVLGLTTEAYVRLFREAIVNSALSEPLKGGMLASLSYSDYYGMGVVVLSVPAQKEVSTLGGEVWIRAGDQTRKASQLEVLSAAKRF